MNGEVANCFIYNGQPQNGATAQLWKITGFASYADSTDEVESNPLEAADIELDVNAGGTFAIGDIIKMGTEVCRITDISTNKLYIIRGYRGTTPAQHVQNVQIDDETITEPVQDTAVPAGSQQGGDVTTGVAYGGDGMYRWTGVPEGEYYASVTYDGHIAWFPHSVEINDPTPLQILTTDGDIMIHNADREVRLPKGASGQFLQCDASRPIWGAVSGLTKELWAPATSHEGSVEATEIEWPVYHLGDAADSAHMSFHVPNDYGGVAEAVIICIADIALNDGDLDIRSSYCADTEAKTTHAESSLAITPTVAANARFEVDVSGILSSLAIDDSVGVSIENNVANKDFWVVGLKFRWT